MQRRAFLKSSLAAAAAVAAAPAASAAASARLSAFQGGKLKQSVARWCYSGIPLDDLCRHAKEIGLVAVDILDEADWMVPAKHGLTCSMCNGPGGISDGWSKVENHAGLVKRAEELLPKIADKGLPNMILFSGNRFGQSQEVSLAACAKGIERILPLAEKVGVTMHMEYLNSRRDHGDYAFDNTAFGLELCKRLDSPRFKLLWDLYHVQIMEGDLIARLQELKAHIGHYHTGGVPGRAEIDQTQEINYPAVVKAIVATGFEGFLAHEFIPRRDPVTSLREAADICKV